MKGSKNLKSLKNPKNPGVGDIIAGARLVLRIVAV